MTDRKTESTSGPTNRAYSGLGYDVRYFARKHSISREEARNLIRKLGHDRSALNDAATQLRATS